MEAEIRMRERGFMFVLSSPSGAGKTTIARHLLERDNNLEMSISVTTRDRREEEKDGKDYYFVDKDQFATMIENNEFLECAEVFDHFYGTPKELVEKQLGGGKDVLFDIDWQGTYQLTQRARDEVVSVFILPPTMAELESRLRKRGQDDDETIRFRMDKASHEISHWYSYDYVIINTSLDASIQKVEAILRAERLRRIRQSTLGVFVEQLLDEDA